MKLAHHIALDPTPEQSAFFARAAGTSRFVYNWALAEWHQQYRAGQKPNGARLKKQFNAIKRDQFPWVLEVHRDASAQPFTNLQRAFVNFFAGRAKRPVFKKKKEGAGSFYVANDKLRVVGKAVILPKVGRVKMREALRFDGKICGASVSRDADRWSIAIQVEVGEVHKERTGDGVVGVDLGLTSLVTLSTGKKVAGPKALRHGLQRLRRLSRRHGRKQKGSRNRKKATLQLARCHRRIKNVRRDHAHKLTTRLCRENQTVVIEDLSIAGMVQHPHLSRAISDAGWGEIQRQLTYKTVIFAALLLVADRWFPSSKKCFRCGELRASLLLSERVFCCERCGYTEDRDVNAAQNLADLGRATPEGTPVERPALARPPRRVKLVSRKQELNRAHVCARER